MDDQTEMAEFTRDELPPEVVELFDAWAAKIGLTEGAAEVTFSIRDGKIVSPFLITNLDEFEKPDLTDSK